MRIQPASIRSFLARSAPHSRIASPADHRSCSTPGGPEDQSMALLPYADIASAPEDVRNAMAQLPRKLNIFRMWAHASTTFVPALRLGGAILSRQKLKPSHRELVILLTAHLEGGAYEWAQHVPIAQGVGCTWAQITALEKGQIDA